MKKILPALFLDQLELGAELIPHDDKSARLRVGRFVCEVVFAEFSEAEQEDFKALYRARQIRFAFPGDFWIKPAFFGQVIPLVAVVNGVPEIPVSLD